MEVAVTRRRIGALLAAFAVSGCLLAGDKKNESEEVATVAGTVFREPGFALPEASVMLSLKEGNPKKTKFKVQKTVTTARGEFGFHVPPVQAIYVVKATLGGYKPEEKEVSVSGAERVEVTLTLARESK
jgi:hypothetical protein